MRGAKVVYRSVKLTDDVDTMTLNISDQLRIMFSRISNDETIELEAEEKVNEDYLRKCAALSSFIDKATRKMVEMKERSVTVLITAELLPCLTEVIDPVKGKGQYYTFEVYKDAAEAELITHAILRIHAKGGVDEKKEESILGKNMFNVYSDAGTLP